MKNCPTCKIPMHHKWTKLVCVNCNYKEKYIPVGNVKDNKPLQIAYYNTSIFKLVLLSVCTLGIYDVYWHYKNWTAIKNETGEKISPLGRGIFLIFYCPRLFNTIFASAKKNGFMQKTSANSIATAYILLIFVGNVSARYSFDVAWLDLLIWTISFFTVIPLASVQEVINFNNAVVNPAHTIDRKFSWKAILLSLIGGLWLLLIVWGVFFPEKHEMVESMDRANKLLMPVTEFIMAGGGADRGKTLVLLREEYDDMQEAYEILVDVDQDVDNTVLPEVRNGYVDLLKASCKVIGTYFSMEVIDAFSRGDYAISKKFIIDHLAWVRNNSLTLTGDETLMPRFIDSILNLPASKTIGFDETREAILKEASKFVQTKEEFAEFEEVVAVLAIQMMLKSQEGLSDIEKSDS